MDNFKQFCAKRQTLGTIRSGWMSKQMKEVQELVMNTEGKVECHRLTFYFKGS